MVDKRIEFIERVQIVFLIPLFLQAQPSNQPHSHHQHSTIKQSDNEICGSRIEHFTTHLLAICNENLYYPIYLLFPIPVFPPFKKRLLWPVSVLTAILLKLMDMKWNNLLFGEKGRGSVGGISYNKQHQIWTFSMNNLIMQWFITLFYIDMSLIVLLEVCRGLERL